MRLIDDSIHRDDNNSVDDSIIDIDNDDDEEVCKLLCIISNLIYT